MTRKSHGRRSKRGQIVVKSQPFVYPASPYKESDNDYPLVTCAVRQVIAQAGLAQARAVWRRQIALVASHQAAAAKAANQGTVMP